MSPRDRGTVYLVGAGPGDPGLATRRALELIARADVVVYDRLVSPRLLEEAPPGAELVYVGKRPGGSVSQADINELLAERALAGNSVVRLKGGDPFVFGRGGEEAEALAEAGVAFEVVPGVTAGIAASAYAGIPVTHRDEASAVAFVTGHEQPEKPAPALDWNALAAFPGTLVFYMGVRNVGSIARRLIEHGRRPEEPAAVIERGSLPGQRTIAASLESIADVAGAEGIQAPAITVVGPVAAMRERLAWFERLPLHETTVVVTRARAQTSALARRLAELGADVIEAPSIRIVARPDAELAAALDEIACHGYDVICFTSPNGVDVLFDAATRRTLDARAFAGATVAAIGPGTAAALSTRGLRADVVPERSVAEALVAELTKLDLEGKRVLVARASEARDVLPEALLEAGADVDVVAIYDTVREELETEVLDRIGQAGYVTFTSSSTVRHFLQAIGGPELLPAAARIVSIGPVTSETARGLGLEVHIEAEHHDIDGLIDALLKDAITKPVA